MPGVSIGKTQNHLFLHYHHSLMKSFHRVLIFTLLLICAVRANVFAQPPPDELWVNISYQDRGINLPPVECYGEIHRADLNAMLGSNGKIAGFLKVVRVAIMDNGQLFQLADVNPNGIKRGYRNVLYIRADTILRIAELDDTFVTQRLLPLKE